MAQNSILIGCGLAVLVFPAMAQPPAPHMSAWQTVAHQCMERESADMNSALSLEDQVAALNEKIAALTKENADLKAKLPADKPASK